MQVNHSELVPFAQLLALHSLLSLQKINCLNAYISEIAPSFNFCLPADQQHKESWDGAEWSDTAGSYREIWFPEGELLEDVLCDWNMSNTFFPLFY